MTTLLYSSEVDDLLRELESSPTRAGLLAGINTALDLLENDPSDARCRRRRFSNIGCWAMALEAERIEWLILWEEGDEGTVIIRAIVPAP